MGVKRQQGGGDQRDLFDEASLAAFLSSHRLVGFMSLKPRTVLRVTPVS
jgi:hypothetical protein